jgi:integrase
MALLDWIKDMRAARKSDGTINRKLAALSKMMSEAVKAGGLAAKPPFPRLREPQGRIRYLNAEEEHALLAVLDQHGKTLEREMVAVLLDTGLRISELLALEARDVDPKANLITIWHNKTDLPRSVKMTRRVRDLVTARLALVKPLDDKRLYPVDYDAFHFVYMRACHILGLDDVVIHTLRHTCCTRLVQRGIDLKTVMAWMGHKSITTTMRYAERAKAP